MKQRVNFNNSDEKSLTCLLSSDETVLAPYLRELPVEQDTVISCLPRWQQCWVIVLMYLAPVAAALQINTKFFKHIK
jgi:energy-converting hydrogenase Eha subunit F